MPIIIIFAMKNILNSKKSCEIFKNKILQSNKNSNNIAFSLIELSIVLIIIGLLVAGITGGASLIQSAKHRALINELQNYRQAVYTFRVAKGRLPGDLDEDGYVGYCYGTGCQSQSYSAGSFGEPYNTKSVHYYVAPFVDLYLERLIDFKPKPEYVNTWSAGNSVPYSKAYKPTYYLDFISFGSYTNQDYLKNIDDGAVFISLYTSSTTTTGKDLPKPFYAVDQKTDDGKYDSGSVRARCGFSGYEETINNKGYCDYLRFRIN